MATGKIQEVAELERNLQTRPNYYIDEVLDILARIYLELGKCAAYAYAMDTLIKQVVLRKTHVLVKLDEN